MVCFYGPHNILENDFFRTLCNYKFQNFCNPDVSGTNEKKNYFKSLTVTLALAFYYVHMIKEAV